MATLYIKVRKRRDNPYPSLNPPDKGEISMRQVRNFYKTPTVKRSITPPAQRPLFHEDPRVFNVYANESLDRKERRQALDEISRVRNEERRRDHEAFKRKLEAERASNAAKRLERFRNFNRLFSPTNYYVDAGQYNESLMVVPGAGSVVDQANPWHATTAALELQDSNFNFCNYVGSTPGSGYSTSYPSGRFVMNRLLQEIGMTPFNLAVMVAEHRQTGAMFVDGAHRLLKAYRYLKKGNFAGVRGKINVMGRNYFGKGRYRDDWLLYRYGVTPLVSDLAGVDAWLSGQYHVPVIKRHKLYEGKIRSEVSRPTNLYPEATRKLTSSDVFVTKSQQVAWVEYDQSHFKTFQQIGLTNPLNVGWEVIPFSFVVDWFIQVGSYLQTLDALTGVKRIAITRAVKNQSHVWINHEEVGSGTRYTRTVLTPGSVRALTYEPSLTAKRVGDAVALLSNAFLLR